jgi:hypothetical protein
MPDFLLPESAASTDPELSSSVPFGSLRKFAHPGFGFERAGHAQQQSASANFQPQSLPAFGGIGLYFPSNNNLSKNSSHSGIGCLIEESEMGVTRQSQTDTVSGISQAMNSGLQLNKSDNFSGSGGLSATIYHQPLRDGPPSNFAPLSSSLTALDMLTQMRQSDSEPTIDASNEAHTANNHLPQEGQEQQQIDQPVAPPLQPLHHLNPHSHQYPESQPNSSQDDDIENNNPDTFGAFDCEW